MLQKNEGDLKEEIEKTKARWDKTISDKNAEKATLDAEVDTLQAEINADDQGKTVSDLTQQISNLTEQEKRLNGSISDARINLVTAEKNVKTKDTKLAQIQAFEMRRKTYQREASEWSYLKNACSKDGLRALEIDSVAPAIAGYANDLLHSTFGPQESIEIQTQNDDGKEVLDILVHRDDGDVTPIEMFSGGQKVWLLKAARLALTMISKEKSGRPFQTCLADEEDGALDSDSGQAFISLYRHFMAQGGFSTCFYISHKPECVAMADHLIELDTNGITIT